MQGRPADASGGGLFGKEKASRYECLLLLKQEIMYLTKTHMEQVHEWIQEGNPEVNIAGLSGASRAYFLASLLTELETPCLIVLPQAKDPA